MKNNKDRFKNLTALSALTFLIVSLIFASNILQNRRHIKTGFGVLAGDCEGQDGDVDILDFQALSNTFAKAPGQTGYNAACNFNSDPMIEILDYQILSNNFGQTGPTGTNTPIPTPGGTTATVATAGDIVCGAGSTGAACKQMETSDLVIQMQPNAVLILGDNQYEEGSLSDFQRYYEPSWGRFKNITRPAVGNHEYLTSGASGYFDYFNGTGVQSGRAGERGKGYYVTGLGQWRLYALNSQLCGGASGSGCARSSAQSQWFISELQKDRANGVQCQIAYFHHPLWTSGSRPTASTRPLYEIMYEYKVELALAGHEHNYERFKPVDANGTPRADGVRQIIVGTGGRNFTAFTHTEANSEVRNDRTFGVLKLVLKPASYDWQFVPIPGSTFTDSGSNGCH